MDIEMGSGATGASAPPMPSNEYIPVAQAVLVDGVGPLSPSSGQIKNTYSELNPLISSSIHSSSSTTSVEDDEDRAMDSSNASATSRFCHSLSQLVSSFCSCSRPSSIPFQPNHQYTLQAQQQAAASPSCYSRLSSQLCAAFNCDSCTRITVPVADWRVTLDQFSAGYFANAAILVFMLLIEEHEIIGRMISVISFFVAIAAIQKYLGYRLTCGEEAEVPVMCRYFPQIACKKIVFNTSNRTISFARFFNGILFWITEIFVFLPSDWYKYLENNSHFPDHRILVAVLCVQVLISVGLYDIIINSFLAR